jgi:ferredoxin-thioredoxin reductase catalytic chain
MVVIVSGSSPAPTPAPVSSVASFSLQRGLLSSSPAVSLSISRRRTCTVRAGGEPSEKSLEVMRKFSEQYARRSETFFCVDKGVTAVVVKVDDLSFFFLV